MSRQIVENLSNLPEAELGDLTRDIIQLNLTLAALQRKGFRFVVESFTVDNEKQLSVTVME